MKKQYGKPEISFDSFALSSNIAGSCGDALTYHSYDDCKHYVTFGDSSNCLFFDNGYSVFSDVGICDVQPDGQSWSQVCYHVIVDEMKAFGS